MATVPETPFAGPRYENRRHAGQELADAVSHLSGLNAIVLGIPRGGVPVALEVAKSLDAGLDVVVARKLGHPDHPDYGLGAVAPGVRVLNQSEIDATGISASALAEVERRELLEVERRTANFRIGQAPPDFEKRVVIVVDDGVALGVTARAALESVWAEHPSRVVFAAPVGTQLAQDYLGAFADEVIIPYKPKPFRAVGLHYKDFEQVTDDAVVEAIQSQPRVRRRPARRTRNAKAILRGEMPKTRPQGP